MENNIFKLYEGLFQVKSFIQNRLESDSHIFICVAGGSATGKTSQVAQRLHDYFKDKSQIISMDNYFHGKEYYEQHNITFDEPDAVNIDLLVEHLQILKTGVSVKIPRFDFVSQASVENDIEIQPTQILIIEGLFALDDRFKDVTDMNIYVETSANGRLIRRVKRDVERTRQKVDDIISIFVNVVNPMHKKHIEIMKKNADIIIMNEFVPYLEMRDVDVDAFIKKHNIPNLD